MACLLALLMPSGSSARNAAVIPIYGGMLLSLQDTDCVLCSLVPCVAAMLMSGRPFF